LGTGEESEEIRHPKKGGGKGRDIIFSAAHCIGQTKRRKKTNKKITKSNNPNQPTTTRQTKTPQERKKTKKKTQGGTTRHVKETSC